jgi:hypothetical protein
MVSILKQPEGYVDREVFNRTVSRHGCIRVPRILPEAPMSHDAVLACIGDTIHVIGAQMGPITRRDGYSSARITLAGGEDLLLYCHAWKQTEAAAQIGIDAIFDWNETYEKSVDVPLAHVDGIMGMFLKWIQAFCTASGFEWADQLCS